MATPTTRRGKIIWTLLMLTSIAMMLGGTYSDPLNRTPPHYVYTANMLVCYAGLLPLLWGAKPGVRLYGILLGLSVAFMVAAIAYDRPPFLPHQHSWDLTIHLLFGAAMAVLWSIALWRSTRQQRNALPAG